MIRRRATRIGLLLAALLVPACGVGGGGTLTPTVAPLSPSGLTASSGPARVDLAWTSSSAASTYDVMRSAVPGGPYTTVPGGAGVTTTTFSDPGLTNGTRYYYVVRASNTFGSADSAEASAVPGLTFTAVSGGQFSTLGLERDGTVWSWGRNSFGALGDGTTERRDAPVRVVGVSGAVGVAAGGQHGAALASDGRVWVWGDNVAGQLGNGIFGGFDPLPALVPSLTGVTALAAGSQYTLALKNDGTVWGWGSGNFGTMGNGMFGFAANQNVPAPVQGLTGIVAIAAASAHCLALHADGTVRAWGRNAGGCLGDGTNVDQNVPVQVTNLNGVTSIAAGGGHSLAVRNDATVFAWGINSSGQLGALPPALPESRVPRLVAGVFGATAVAAGSNYSYALIQNGEVFAWGDNSSGQLGNGSTALSVTPVRVSTLIDTVAIASGGGHGLALRDDGVLWAWGTGSDGQLGNGVSGGTLPGQVYNLTGVTNVGAGFGTGYANRTDATGVSVWSWGDDGLGTFGTGSVTRSNIPFQNTALSAFTAFDGGTTHAIGLRNDATVWGWGDGTWGQLGGGSSATPVQIAIPAGVTAISARENHNVALRSGVVWQWGSMGMFGGGGALGTAPGLTNVTAISAGMNHNLALRNDQTVWAWGENTVGQLGNGGSGPMEFIAAPAQVLNLTLVQAVAAGGSHNLALRTDGTVWGWGSNGYGQIGQDATVGSSVVPVQVPALAGVVAISAGEYHSAALKADGTVWTWGNNSSGQFGVGSTTDSQVPLQVPGLTGITQVVCGDHHTFALHANTTVWSWGWNAYGQLGQSPNSAGSSIPVEVAH